MDLERCSLSSSVSSTSSSAADSSFWSGSSSETADRMELEAAEALADLAHLASRESGNAGDSGGGGGKWGSKGKRGQKRVKTESPPVDSFSQPVFDPVPTFPDPAPDQAVVDQQHGELLCANVEVTLAKAEPDANVPKPSLFSAKCQARHGGRSRQSLTEAEKEERRLRRILANRESARQTIRRRQALCEELTRKSADLAWENENLKREKESVLKEFQSLESQNKHLKAQMAKLIKTKLEESPSELKLANVERSTPSTNCSLLLYNQHPFSSFCWPSIVQSSNPVQSYLGPQSAIVIPSNISMSPNRKPDLSLQQHENCAIVNGPRSPLYIVPCPWFFPVPDNENGTYVNNQGGSSSTHMKKQFSSPEKIESEAASSAEVRVINDLNDVPVGFPQDGHGQCAGPCPEEPVLASVTLSSTTPAVAVKQETGFQSEFAPQSESISLKSGQMMNTLHGSNHDPFKFQSKKLVDAAAAAEARRRRKELTKLKNLHIRQCRMNC